MKFRKTADEKAQTKAKKKVEKLLNEADNYYNIYLDNYLGEYKINKEADNLFDNIESVSELLKKENMVTDQNVKDLKTSLDSFKNKLPKHIRVAIGAKIKRIKVDGVLRKLKGRVSLKEMKKAVTTKNKK